MTVPSSTSHFNIPHDHMIMIWVIGNHFALTIGCCMTMITWSTFATFPTSFPRKSMGKLTRKVASSWAKFSSPAHLSPTFLHSCHICHLCTLLYQTCTISLCTLTLAVGSWQEVTLPNYHGIWLAMTIRTAWIVYIATRFLFQSHQFQSNLFFPWELSLVLNIMEALCRIHQESY